MGIVAGMVGREQRRGVLDRACMVIMRQRRKGKVRSKENDSVSWWRITKEREATARTHDMAQMCATGEDGIRQPTGNLFLLYRL